MFSFFLYFLSVSLSPSFSPHIREHSHRHIYLYNSSGKNVLKWHDLIRKTDQIQVVLMVKNLPINAGDMTLGFDPWVRSGRSSGGGPGNPLQCSCLENPMTEESGRLHSMGVTKSQTWLKQLSTHDQIPGRMQNFLKEQWKQVVQTCFGLDFQVLSSLPYPVTWSPVYPNHWPWLCFDSDYFDALSLFFQVWIPGFAVFIPIWFWRYAHVST